MERIVSMTKSDNDSLLYVAFENLISTYKTSDGSLVKSDSVDGSYNLIMSKDGKTLVAAGDYGVGLLDPITFKKIFWSNPDKLSDNPSLMLNEVQNKFVICGSPSLIWIYDVKTKSLDKELKPIYYENGNKILRNARLTNDGKFVMYGYLSYNPSNPSIIYYYVKMMDMEGNLVKDFGETSSTNFALTNDGRTLIYFKSDGIHFFDLEVMKETEIIPSGGLNPARIEMSSDGKIMLMGFAENSNIINSLVYFDLETKKYNIAWEGGTWEMFKMKKDNSGLFFGIDKHISKFSFKPNTSIAGTKNKLELTIQVMGNNLFVKSAQELKNNLTFKIISVDSKIVKTILPNETLINSNGVQFDISNLQSGAYFLQISDNQNIISILKFLKAN